MSCEDSLQKEIGKVLMILCPGSHDVMGIAVTGVSASKQRNIHGMALSNQKRIQGTFVFYLHG